MSGVGGEPKIARFYVSRPFIGLNPITDVLGLKLSIQIVFVENVDQSVVEKSLV